MDGKEGFPIRPPRLTIEGRFTVYYLVFNSETVQWGKKFTNRLVGLCTSQSQFLPHKVVSLSPVVLVLSYDSVSTYPLIHAIQNSGEGYVSFKPQNGGPFSLRSSMSNRKMSYFNLDRLNFTFCTWSSPYFPLQDSLLFKR